MADFTLKYDGSAEQLVGQDPNGNKIAIPLNDVDVSGAVNTDEINDNGSGEVSIASPLTVRGRQTTGSLPMGVAQNYQSGPAHGEGANAFQGATVAPSGQVILAPRDSSNVGVSSAPPGIALAKGLSF